MWLKWVPWSIYDLDFSCGPPACPCRFNHLSAADSAFLLVEAVVTTTLALVFHYGSMKECWSLRMICCLSRITVVLFFSPSSILVIVVNFVQKCVCLCVCVLLLPQPGCSWERSRLFKASLLIELKFFRDVQSEVKLRGDALNEIRLCDVAGIHNVEICWE